MNTIYNRLVATGDPDADAALRLSSTVCSLLRSLGWAYRALAVGQPDAYTPWPPAATEDNPLGCMPALQTALSGVRTIEAIREQVEDLVMTVHDRNELLADRVRLQLGRENDPSFTLDEIRLYTSRGA